MEILPITLTSVTFSKSQTLTGPRHRDGMSKYNHAVCTGAALYSCTPTTCTLHLVYISQCQQVEEVTCRQLTAAAQWKFYNRIASALLLSNYPRNTPRIPVTLIPRHSEALRPLQKINVITLSRSTSYLTVWESKQNCSRVIYLLTQSSQETGQRNSNDHFHCMNLILYEFYKTKLLFLKLNRETTAWPLRSKELNEHKIEI